jgi:hypothetical protein
MKLSKSVRLDIRLANIRWGRLNGLMRQSLIGTLQAYQLSLTRGDMLLLGGKWYVTHSGLLRIAARKNCHGLLVGPVKEFCDSGTARYVFRAVVYTSPACKGFVGYGDADPSNVSTLVRGAEMRVAETRAVNRALRKAYGIGICSVEEIGPFPSDPGLDQEPTKNPAHSSNENGTGTGKGSTRVRDRLVQLIRQYQLNPDLVKAYAVDFCGAKTLKEATRAQVEGFVDHLGGWASKDRDALLCQLNSYPRQKDQGEEKAGAA